MSRVSVVRIMAYLVSNGLLESVTTAYPSSVLLFNEILVLLNAYYVFIEEDRKPFAERDVL